MVRSGFREYEVKKLHYTGSSKINGAKFSEACSIRANWLCMRQEFQIGEKKFCTMLYKHLKIEHAWENNQSKAISQKIPWRVH